MLVLVLMLVVAVGLLQVELVGSEVVIEVAKVVLVVLE